MTPSHPPPDRESLLADVAEMYYLEQRGQAEIARTIGVTRSMISRLLTEARARGIVEIRVRRTVQRDHDLESALVARFNLQEACVSTIPARLSGDGMLSYLGKAGAQTLLHYLAPGSILGLAWGTTISATVDALDVEQRLDLKIVQLVGAMGARNAQYDGHALILRLVDKLGGEGYYLNAPFLCPDPETADALRRAQSIKDTIELGKRADVALVGVGSSDPHYSSYYLAGYVSSREQARLQRAGAVGDVCGLHFDIQGRYVCEEFTARCVTICKEDLFKIPVRVGVAGGEGKLQPVLGALRGGFINALVTDAATAHSVLES